MLNIRIRFSHLLRRNGSRTLLYSVLSLYAAFSLFPLFQALLSSLKSSTGIYSGALVWPAKLHWGNYATAWVQGNFSTYFKNSLFVVFLSVAGILAFSSMAAYVLARHSFRGNTFLLLYFLVGLMLPFRLVALPVFVLLRQLHLLNTLWGLVCVYISAAEPFSIFILVNYFKSIPKAIEEAAIIDGAGPFRIYAQILLPLIQPALVTVAVVNFAWVWNDFFTPLILIQSPERQTLMLGLNAFFGRYLTQWNYVLAATNITLGPILLFYAFASRRFIKGLTWGAGK